MTISIFSLVLSIATLIISTYVMSDTKDNTKDKTVFILAAVCYAHSFIIIFYSALYMKGVIL